MTAAAYATGYGPRYRLAFDGDESKYELWEVKFLGYMRLQKLYDVIVAPDDNPPDAAKNVCRTCTVPG